MHLPTMQQPRGLRMSHPTVSKHASWKLADPPKPKRHTSTGSPTKGNWIRFVFKHCTFPQQSESHLTDNSLGGSIQTSHPVGYLNKTINWFAYQGKLDKVCF